MVEFDIFEYFIELKDVIEQYSTPTEALKSIRTLKVLTGHGKIYYYNALYTAIYLNGDPITTENNFKKQFMSEKFHDIEAEIDEF